MRDVFMALTWQKVSLKDLNNVFLKISSIISTDGCDDHYHNLPYCLIVHHQQFYFHKLVYWTYTSRQSLSTLSKLGS